MDADETGLCPDAGPVSRRVIALCMELEAQGIEFARQRVLDVRYKGRVVGSFVADLMVAERLLIELKAVRAFVPDHEAQVINYLRATGLHVALLLNFGSKRLQIRRLVLEHDDRRPI